jgi:hypothetical protein
MKPLYMELRSYNRTYRYVYPLLALYPITVLSKIQKADVLGVYLGNAERSTEGIHVVTKTPVVLDEYIIDSYYNFSTKSHVCVIKVLERYKKLLEKFWEGKYSTMYDSLHHVPKTYGTKINMTYQILSGTLTAKLEHKEYLIKFRYVDPETFTKANDISWEEFLPEEGDFKPAPREEILNYRDDTTSA